MPRSDEAEHFINGVYEAVQEVPHGRVTTYAHIAKLLGYPKRPRQVGVALRHLPRHPGGRAPRSGEEDASNGRNQGRGGRDEPEERYWGDSADEDEDDDEGDDEEGGAQGEAEAQVPFFNERNVPWQRVVNSKGGISPRGPGGTARHAAALRREGVEVHRDAMGEFSVDMSRYGWFPELLPTEEAMIEGEGSEGEE